MNDLCLEFPTYKKARAARSDSKGKRSYIARSRSSGGRVVYLADSSTTKGYRWTYRYGLARRFAGARGAQSRLSSLKRMFPSSGTLKKAKAEAVAGRSRAATPKKRRARRKASPSAAPARKAKRRAAPARKAPSKKKNPKLIKTADGWLLAGDLPPGKPVKVMINKEGKPVIMGSVKALMNGETPEF